MKLRRPLFDLAGCVELDRAVGALRKCSVAVSNSNEQKSSFLLAEENSLLTLTRSDLMDTMGGTLGTRNITIQTNPHPPYPSPPRELIGDIIVPVSGPPTINTPSNPNQPIIVIGYKPPGSGPGRPIQVPPIIGYKPTGGENYWGAFGGAIYITFECVMPSRIPPGDPNFTGFGSLLITPRRGGIHFAGYDVAVKAYYNSVPIGAAYIGVAGLNLVDGSSVDVSGGWPGTPAVFDFSLRTDYTDDGGPIYWDHHLVSCGG